MLITLLLASLMTHATPKPERLIECSAQSKDGAEVLFRIESKVVVLKAFEGPETRFPILSEKVVGKGAKARKVIKSKSGEISFKDVYGCFKDAKGSLDGMQLSGVKCKDPAKAVPCQDGPRSGPPKADK